MEEEDDSGPDELEFDESNFIEKDASSLSAYTRDLIKRGVPILAKSPFGGKNLKMNIPLMTINDGWQKYINIEMIDLEDQSKIVNLIRSQTVSMGDSKKIFEEFKNIVTVNLGLGSKYNFEVRGGGFIDFNSYQN